MKKGCTILFAQSTRERVSSVPHIYNLFINHQNVLMNGMIHTNTHFINHQLLLDFQSLVNCVERCVCAFHTVLVALVSLVANNRVQLIESVRGSTDESM